MLHVRNYCHKLLKSFHQSCFSHNGTTDAGSLKSPPPPLHGWGPNLHVVEDEEQRLCGKPLEEFTAVHVWWRVLAVVGLARVGVPLEVVPAGSDTISYVRMTSVNKAHTSVNAPAHPMHTHVCTQARMHAHTHAHAHTHTPLT